MEIVFWNCQGLNPKRKELEPYLVEGNVDLKETFPKLHMDFSLSGYEIKRNYWTWSQKAECVFVQIRGNSEQSIRRYRFQYHNQYSKVPPLRNSIFSKQPVLFLA